MRALHRRTVIGWGAAVAGVVGARWGLSMLPSGAPAGSPVPKVAGYGIDPPLLNPKRHVWPAVFDRRMRHDLDALIDLVVPATNGAPAGSELGLADFFDEWLGAPYPDMIADRALLAPVLQAVTGLAHAPLAQRKTRVETLAAGASATAFRRFCQLAAAAYYTTPAGTTALGFVGNEPRPTFDGPPASVLEHFDAEFAKLEIKR